MCNFKCVLSLKINKCIKAFIRIVHTSKSRYRPLTENAYTFPTHLFSQRVQLLSQEFDRSEVWSLVSLGIVLDKIRLLILFMMKYMNM